MGLRYVKKINTLHFFPFFRVQDVIWFNRRCLGSRKIGVHQKCTVIDISLDIINKATIIGE